jgi:hypothetical protein
MRTGKQGAIVRLIRQRQKKDCGVACVAMLAGVSYSVAKKAMFGDGAAGLTEASDLRAALADLGRSPGRLVPLRRRDYRKLNGPALLKTNVRANGEWHWLVWSGKKILDPKKPPYQLSRLRPISYLRVT